MSTIWVKGDPIELVEGAARPLTYRFPDTVSSPTITVYKGWTDITDDVMSGSNSVSGRMLTTKTMTAQSGHGGSEYIVTIQATVSGRTDIYKDRVKIQKPGQGR